MECALLQLLFFLSIWFCFLLPLKVLILFLIQSLMNAGDYSSRLVGTSINVSAWLRVFTLSACSEVLDTISSPRPRGGIII